MRSHAVSIIGKISDEGRLMISNQAEMNEFFNQWKGKRVIMVASIYPGEPSRQLIGYYFKKIVPDFQRVFREKEGERQTLRQVDLRLREMSFVCHVEVDTEEADGFSLDRLKSVYELSNYELVEHVEFLRMIAGKEYDLYIEDPKRFED